MYATICKETGVIRSISDSRTACEIEKMFQEELCNHPHVVVEIPQLMLDDFGARLRDVYKQKEVSE